MTGCATTDYDVVVVGARCAGSPAAMLLARQGYRVLLVDRMTFPSDMMSSHFIPAYGVTRLMRWGLWQRLLATGCPPVSRITSDWGTVRLTGTPTPYEGVTSLGVCPRRYILDAMLLDAATDAGAEVEQAFTVTGLIRADDGRVNGIVGRRGGGAEVRVSARFVVGADGMRSLVAREVDAGEYWTIPSLTVTYLTYFADLPMDDGLVIHWRPGRCVPAIPTHDGLTVVLCGWPHDEWRTYRSDIEKHFFDTVSTQASPEFAERMRDARRVERFRGTHHVPNFFRTPFGPGWALVGDAGYHKDPVTAMGIADAFRDVEHLTTALHEALSGQRPEAEALADYERRRNADAEPLYRHTVEQAQYQPLDQLTTLVLRALADNEVDRNRFFGVLAGSVPPSEFSAPHNVARILAGAGLLRDVS
jgi:2-polyprenyl-6-methoxyphenol hydroxylase-like FAD-dependent oxidoreductase